jgi:xanthine dehydrogenase accessory factor
MMPAPTLCVIGETPVTAAIAKIGPLVGLNIMTAARGDEMDLSDVTAMVIGTHGHFEPESIRAALDATVPFIGLVASEKRGAGVLDAMGLTEKERARISTPVGVEIGAKGAEEIALSIVAGVVRALRIDNVSPRVASALPNAERGVDPICGMTVTIRPDAISAVKDGVTYWFCCAGCKETFLAA